MEQQPLGSAPPDERYATPTVVVASRYGTLWALDARDGHLLWHALPTSEPAPSRRLSLAPLHWAYPLDKILLANSPRSCCKR
jgi:hypothetical protein